MTSKADIRLFEQLQNGGRCDFSESLLSAFATNTAIVITNADSVVLERNGEVYKAERSDTCAWQNLVDEVSCFDPKQLLCDDTEIDRLQRLIEDAQED